MSDLLNYMARTENAIVETIQYVKKPKNGEVHVQASYSLRGYDGDEKLTTHAVNEMMLAQLIEGFFEQRIEDGIVIMYRISNLGLETTHGA